MKLTSSAKLYSSHASVVWSIIMEEVTEKEQQYSKRPRKKETQIQKGAWNKTDLVGLILMTADPLISLVRHSSSVCAYPLIR